MLVQFHHLKSVIKVKDITIDNVAFRLHYRLTMYIFLVATALVCSRQYIGEHIKCIADRGVSSEVIDTFCFFTATFTVLGHYNESLVAQGILAHPGVGPYAIDSNEETIRHAYYQWVPFMLFLQAIMFYLPHMWWKSMEGGRLHKLAEGLRIGITTRDGSSFDCGGVHVMSTKEKERRIEDIRDVFENREKLFTPWMRRMTVCEILNLLNVLLQVYITDWFLSHQFFELGLKVIAEGVENHAGILEVVFPKVTKCTFHKYGPSGSIQSHDAMCVMALNIINEKIYVFLWFWLTFLFLCSSLAVLYRFASMLLHSRSNCFNGFMFSPGPSTKSKPFRKEDLASSRNYGKWLFLHYLSSNLDPLIFREVLSALENNSNTEDSKNDLKMNAQTVVCSTEESERDKFLMDEKS